LDGFVDELELARGLEGRVVVGEIAAAASLVWRDRVLPLAALEHVARAREGRNDPTIVAIGVAPGVVEMQVRVYDQRHVRRTHAERFQLVEKARRILDPKYFLLPVGELRAGPGLHDHHVVGVADEQAVHVHRRATRDCASSVLKAIASSRPRSPDSTAVAAGCITSRPIPMRGGAASRRASCERSRTVSARWAAGSSTSSYGRARRTRWPSGPASAT